MLINNIEKSQWYKKLNGNVTDEILKIRDDKGIHAWERVHEKVLGYFTRNCLGYPWTNHLALIVLARTINCYDIVTVLRSMQEINPTLKALFPAFGLTNMDQFIPDEHIYKYLTKQILDSHSDNKRVKFLNFYNSCIRAVHEWVRTKFDEDTAFNLKKYIFQSFSYHPKEIHLYRSTNEQAHETRKNETDALVPLFPSIRAEAHLRWNQLNRLRLQFTKVVEAVEQNKASLPVDFNYDDRDINDETVNKVDKFYFRLWDQRSFVLNHQENFSRQKIKEAKSKFKTYRDENQEYFLEFVKAETIKGANNTSNEPEGFWFEELLREGVLGGARNTTNSELKDRRRNFLIKWGYGSVDKPNSYPKPFAVAPPGVLTQGNFIALNQKHATGILLNPNSLFAAATFGLAAIDIITTTGARINEVLQIRNSKDCFVVKNIQDGDKNITRYLFRVIPKGRTEPENFYLSDQSVKILGELRKMLNKHYQDGKIPSVKYRGGRGMLVDTKSPYLFQYNSTGLDRQDVTACMRFLLHGMIFEDQHHNPIIIKPHLLRHAFANHLQYAQKMPIDIIASILHQKDITTTEYYAEATDTQVAIKTHELHQIMATYIELNSAVIREPEELVTAIEEAKEKVGVYTQTVGGLCSIDAVCPVKMACVGCGGKIPTPEKKQELIVYKNWAEQSMKLWEEQGQPLETQKMRAAIKAADKELYEIDLIEKYVRDEKYEPELRIEE